MSPSNNDEVDRLKRIRDRQLADRDPSGKRRGYTNTYSRQRSARQPLTLKSAVNTFSNKLKGLFMGIVLGVITWIVLSLLVTAPWVDWAGLAAILAFAGAGVLVGASFDWRDNLRNF